MSLKRFRCGGWSGYVSEEFAGKVSVLLNARGEALPYGRGASESILVDGERFVRKILRRGGVLGAILGEVCGGPTRLLRPLRLLSRLEDAGIEAASPTLAAWRHRKLTFRLVTATRFVEGCDLLDTDEERVWVDAAHLALTLSTAGLHHCDFHPRNIRVKEEGGVVLLDLEDLRRGYGGAVVMWRRLGRFLIKHGHWERKQRLWLLGAEVLGQNASWQERQLLLEAAAHLLL